MYDETKKVLEDAKEKAIEAKNLEKKKEVQEALDILAERHGMLKEAIQIGETAVRDNKTLARMVITLKDALKKERTKSLGLAGYFSSTSVQENLLPNKPKSRKIDSPSE